MPAQLPSFPASLPTGTITLLFTDLEGHSRLWEDDPETMRRALAWHDTIVRAAIEGNGGHVVKTTGDGFHAVFASAASALTAALAAQRALSTEQWPTSTPLRARMALHTGVAELRGGDYYGSAVNRAARLMSAGHGGQLLISAATHELLRDALPDDTALRSLGEQRLGDLHRPEHIYQFVAHDLPSEFPPIRTLDNRPNNLPAQATALIGRDREIEAACSRLQRPDVRLLTLTGPGGTGKTRLGLQVAAQLLSEPFESEGGLQTGFAHGVFLVQLAAISDPSLILSAIAQALGLRETMGLQVRSMLLEYLRAREILLLLDNFEQILAGASELANLLATCPRVKLLVTSRQPLHIYGEHELPVPPLRLPDPTVVPMAANLLGYEAIRLFVERAQSIDPEFRIGDGNAASIVGICQRLDGLPLGIELAAPRLKLLSPRMLLDRLESRLAVLTGGARDRPARQQTLRETIGWSHDLLTETEQRLFRRLAVFRGGWTLDAAEAICGAPGEVFDDLASLVDKSLVQKRELPNGDTRFTLLETVREYALERLVERGGLDELRRHHAEYFCAFAEALDAGMRGPRLTELLGRLERDHDNFRAALEWTLDGAARRDGTPREPCLALRLAGALAWFWHLDGHATEGREWLRAALGSAPESNAARLKGLLGAGWLAHLQEDRDAACALMEEAIAIADQVGDAWARAWALNVIGRAHYSVGDLVPARAFAERSLTLAEEGGFGWIAGWAHALIGRVETIERNYVAARAAVERSLAIRREIGDSDGTGHAIGLLSFIDVDEGKWEEGRARAAETLRLFGLRHPWGATYALETLAVAEGGLGFASRCVRLLAASERRRETLRSYPITDVRAVRERVLESAKRTLGPAAYAAEWSTGLAMTPDRAVEYALAEIDSSEASSAGTLSAREVEVARLVARGKTNRQIADALVISERTADRHVANILAKLGFKTRTQVAAWVAEQG